MFVEVTSDQQLNNCEEHWLRRIDSKCWISVLCRLTGFGWMEWETAIVFLHETGDRQPTWKDRDCLIITGDRREELATMPAEQLRAWYAAHIKGYRSSMETIFMEAEE